MKFKFGKRDPSFLSTYIVKVKDLTSTDRAEQDILGLIAKEGQEKTFLIKNKMPEHAAISLLCDEPFAKLVKQMPSVSSVELLTYKTVIKKPSP